MLLDILFFIETYTVFDHSSPKERFKAKATLLSKTFSYFPHGTCLLSVPNTYLAADGIYHQFCAPVPRNVTPGTKHRAQRHAHDTQDLNPPGCFFFQKAFTCTVVGHSCPENNSRQKAPIPMLCLSMFIRHYS